MTELFADTSYWMALVNPRDNLHAKARSVSREFASARVITSEMVLTELLNGFSDGGAVVARRCHAGRSGTARKSGYKDHSVDNGTLRDLYRYCGINRLR